MRPQPVGNLPPDVCPCQPVMDDPGQERVGLLDITV